MAEFWPENQSESSCARMAKSSSSGSHAAVNSGPGEDPPTILSSGQAVLPASGPMVSMARELAGEMLAHFRLDDYVGVGGMGAVFRATDVRLDRSVALKILPPDQAKDPEIVQRFRDEARAAARLDHENIARAYFIGEDRGLHFIAFEFVEGVNIRDVIAQCGPLPPHEVVNYSIQIAGALVHAAARGVVHRDIKPSNIIITLAGRAKLVDMGLARNFERRHDGCLTQSNVTLGTFDYISPEQARDPRSADARSDIYSLGCTLFHMLTGRPPYPEGTVLQKLLKHHAESPPDPREFNPQVPGQLALVVQRMMAKDPARRQQDPQTLLAEFLEIASDMGLRSTSPEGLIWVSDRPGTPISKMTGAIWGTAAAVLILAVWRIYATSTASPDIPRPALAAPTIRIPDRSLIDTPPLNPDRDSRRPIATEPVDASPATDQEPGQAAPPPELMPENPPVAEVIVVGSDQDLRAAIAQAPSGSIIELTGDHRPQTTHKVDDTAGIRIEGKQLTIKAAPGSKPRLILSYDAQAFGVADWNLLTVVNSRLEIEGVQFEVQVTGQPPAAMSMITCHSSQVLLRRCSFFQGVDGGLELTRRDGEPVAWVVQLDRGIGLDGRIQSGRVTATECFFGGGEGAFRVAGSARADLTDCVLLPYRSAFLIRSVGAAPAPPAELRLNNVSLFAHTAPIFDLRFARAAVSSNGVIYSHEQRDQGTLARVDADSRLEWRGNRNIYHGFRQFLVARGAAGQEMLARRLDDWQNLPNDVDEQSAMETDEPPFLISLAEAALRNTTDSQIADAFRTARPADDPTFRPVGSRFVLPWGALYESGPADSTAANRVKQFAPNNNWQIGVVGNDGARPFSNGDTRTEKPKSEGQASRSGELNGTPTPPGTKLDANMKKIINTMPTLDPAPPAESTETARAAEPIPSSARNALVVDPASPNAYSTLAAACARAEDGSVIEIRSSDRLREGPIELGDRHLTVLAAPGYRPIIEFRPTQFDLRGRDPRLFDIRRGSLTLKDIDLHLIADSTVSAEPWAAIASRSADVHMDGCTVVVEGNPGVSSCVVRFLTSEVDDPMSAPTGESPLVRPQFQLRHSFATGMSQLVRIQPAVRVRMEIENCALDVQDNLIAVLGGMDRSVIGSVNEIEIRHATVRMRRGLVSYEASEVRGWLPRLEITVADNLLMNEGESPWIRFRSPRSADELRGLLHWKGMNNSYQGADDFWQIESMMSGELELLNWDEWTRSPAREEIKADRGRIDFSASTAGVDPWLYTRDHFKPARDVLASEMASDGGPRGANLERVPAPPQERSATH